MTWWVVGIIVGSLGVAAILGGWIYATNNDALKASVSRPDWSVQSWVSNLSAIGAVLGVVLAGASLPQSPTPLDTKTFVALAAFFVFLTVSGPFVFQCLATHGSSADKTLYASNRTLLVACSLALAAVIGQLATLALLYWEILGGAPWGVVGIAVAALLAGLAVRYYVETVPWLIQRTRTRALKANGKAKFKWSLL